MCFVTENNRTTHRPLCVTLASELMEHALCTEGFVSFGCSLSKAAPNYNTIMFHDCVVVASCFIGGRSTVLYRCFSLSISSTLPHHISADVTLSRSHTPSLQHSNAVVTLFSLTHTLSTSQQRCCGALSISDNKEKKTEGVHHMGSPWKCTTVYKLPGIYSVMHILKNNRPSPCPHVADS